ncbi:uncharacterized protein BXIN_0897 [Babesia sp. Xinjiang]|uniref:uncharacterized protein n=1 Tax=Babesia sp. Xinjiang TaxID=462227 RepID=UPI000A24D7E8|nr:uncharacterized protein BXIN_0897 [Babesia sp. Xinjiang]ORM41241.1 hypothetical protein BXIN_0897 [Babesia sp. Xinjiang]
MDIKAPDVYKQYQNFPPLYTEQINDVVLSKQLEIWETLIRKESSEHRLYVINVDDVGVYPFYNAKINRKLKRDFLTLIAQHMVEKGCGFYLHTIKRFCKENECSVWYVLFIGRNSKINKLRALHDQEYQTITSKASKRDSNIATLKLKRDILESKQVVVGVFSKTMQETADEVLRYLRSHLHASQVETPYFLFYGGRESTKPFSLWPEEHIAIIISTLVTQKQIALVLNETASARSLSSKQLGIQLIGH